jgi:hypothetical protein
MASNPVQIPVEYITISGPVPSLPENPFEVVNQLLLKTNDELKQMDMKDLMKYSSSISTSIALEASTLKANQAVQARYLYLTMESQRIIDELDAQIAMNKAMIDSYTEHEETYDYDKMSTAYISTMAEYEAYIALLRQYIAMYNSSLSSYVNIQSQIDAENSVFNKAATQYSSLYMIYYAYQTQYDNLSSELTAVTTRLDYARGSEKASYEALEESTLRWNYITDTLASLRSRRPGIQENIIVCTREESRTYLNYMSTLDALQKISSIYFAALANETYARSISTATSLTTDYSYALERFNEAELLYKNSLPQGGGGESGSVQGNSVLLAARSMAYQQLQRAEADKIAAENATAGLLNLAGLANTDAYETMLLGYDNSILAHATTEQKYRNYKLSSLQQVAEFSSIYDTSVADIQRYSQQVKEFSSFYESSLIGASTLLSLSEIDLSTIEGDTADYYAVSWSISSLNERYSTCLSEFDTAVKLSTLFQEEYLQARKIFYQNTEYYDSTNKQVLALTYELFGTTGSNGLINVYNNTIFTYSSILNRELINEKIYDTQIKEFIHLQDMAMHEYRETYCRSTRFAYQKDYESKVYAEVLYAQSLTDAQQANSPPGVTVAPVPANLTTAVVSDSYAKLVSIYSFLDLFEAIYTTFDTQATNIKTLSTSVGNEFSAWSTLDFYTKAQFANRTWATRTYGEELMSSISKYITLSCDTFTAAQLNTSTVRNTYALAQSTLDMKKRAIRLNLPRFYSAAEILDQDTVISSFIIQSIDEANILIELQGTV